MQLHCVLEIEEEPFFMVCELSLEHDDSEFTLAQSENAANTKSTLILCEKIRQGLCIRQLTSYK